MKRSHVAWWVAAIALGASACSSVLGSDDWHLRLLGSGVGGGGNGGASGAGGSAVHATVGVGGFGPGDVPRAWQCAQACKDVCGNDPQCLQFLEVMPNVQDACIALGQQSEAKRSLNKCAVDN